MDSSSKKTRSSLFVVALCFLTIAVDGYDLIIYGATIPRLLEEPGWQLGPAGAGLIGSWTLAGLMVGLLGAGPMADRIGRRKLIMAGVLWFSVGSLLCAIAHSPHALGVARFITGIGLGGVVPSSVALTIEYAPRSRRQLYSALALTGYPVGGVICALLAIAMLESHGWRILYGFGALYIVILPVMFFFLPESVSHLLDRGRVQEARALAMRYGIDFDQVVSDEQEHRRSRIGAAGVRGYRLLMSSEFRSAILLFALMCFCGQLVVYGLNAWLPQLMRKSGYPLGSSLQFLLVMQFGAVAGNLCGSWLADRYGSKRVLAPFFLICTASLLVLSQKPDFVWLMFAVFGAGLGSIGSTTLGYGYIAAFFPASCRGSAIGAAQGIGRIGSILGPMIGGWVLASNLGHHWNFYAFAIPAVIAAVVVTFIPKAGHCDASYAEV
ncbi:Major facilitator transporter [Paraburkholderia piptadeniae]|uniref:Major facilitator transporter n=1 Tax=Paraburkholderia piptadeniae TaxID=1701573 RepID=A0A1N7S2W3_9BURK|nr:aromatic acid/H+ symport family MFS transporter [Paraburkholderia piptadeniae]SIT41734.1 Major facilitator transporter [Paraburkholderia piptadeniae]